MTLTGFRTYLFQTFGALSFQFVPNREMYNPKNYQFEQRNILSEDGVNGTPITPDLDYDVRRNGPFYPAPPTGFPDTGEFFFLTFFGVKTWGKN